MSETAISIQNVSKDFKLAHERADSVKSLFINPFNPDRRRYEVQHALKDISVDIKKGEFFGIVGRNGSGKSTLLKIIAGIYKPTSGQVGVSGRLVPFIELGVGFNPELTGRENIYLNGALMGFSEKEIDEKYDSIVDFAELDRFMDQKLKNYSSGMQVRLAFSVATILADSEILLVDEVLAVGDADFQRKCFDYFKSLKKNKKTVVFVSHDMDAVREYCDRAMLIEDSQAVKIGKTKQVAELYSRLFLGEDKAEPGAHGKKDKPESDDRWGSFGMKTKNVIVAVNNKAVTITQTITSRVDISNPVIGLRLRDAAGSAITGTNTRIAMIDLPTIVSGDTLTVIWNIPNIFVDGTYFVDLAIQEEDGITTLDWWNEARSFRIKKELRIPYSVDPGIKISVKTH